MTALTLVGLIALQGPIPDLPLYPSSNFAPRMLSRADWSAKETLPGGRKQLVSHITIHHAGVPTNYKRTFAEVLRGLQTFSQREDKLDNGKTKPAWIDIPYHFYVSWRGEIAQCRPLQWAGDTNTEYDPKGHLLICLEGDFNKEQPTPAALRALRSLVSWARVEYSIPELEIQSHRDFAQTDCPGKNLYWQLDEIRRTSR